MSRRVSSARAAKTRSKSGGAIFIDTTIWLYQCLVKITFGRVRGYCCTETMSVRGDSVEGGRPIAPGGAEAGRSQGNRLGARLARVIGLASASSPQAWSRSTETE